MRLGVVVSVAVGTFCRGGRTGGRGGGRGRGGAEEEGVMRRRADADYFAVTREKSLEILLLMMPVVSLPSGRCSLMVNWH